VSARAAVCPLFLSIGVLAGAASGAASNRPSDRGCLLAWNAPANHANRVKLLTMRPVRGLSLRTGTSFTDTWAKGGVAKQTSTEACLLTVAKRGTIQLVTGRWRGGGVSGWSWGRVITTAHPFAANVRLLPDGRVTKIYRR
jgi:hypothetical protein